MYLDMFCYIDNLEIINEMLPEFLTMQIVICIAVGSKQ